MTTLIPVYPLVPCLRIMEDDVYIDVQYVRRVGDCEYYHREYYNPDEQTFLDVLNALRAVFRQEPKGEGDVEHIERYALKEISWTWFRRRFAEVQKANGRKIVCGCTDAKSAFLLGVLSACHNRVALLHTTDDRHFWRMIKILERTK